MLKLDDIFNTRLADLVSNYVFRQEQLTLADNIMSAMRSGDNGIFEAGTGTGKTLSYLVPALLSEQTTIVSTGTRNLQDQLLEKDIPLLKSLFPAKRIAVLKGRANYLCVHRLKINLKTARDDAREANQLTDVRVWWSSTETGDLTELLDPEETPALMPLITSTRDNCMGSRCPEFSVCPLYRAREIASQADLVIVNHHLLFADLAQKEDSLSALLPQAGNIVIDEAHRVPDVARQFFGSRVGSGQLSELIRDLKTELKLLGNDDPATLASAGTLEQKLDRLRDLVLASQEADFNLWYRGAAHQAVGDVDLALGELSEYVGRVSDRSEGLKQISKRILRFTDQFALLTEESDSQDGYVHWIERRPRSFSIHLSPLSIANELTAHTSSPDVSWVFTSATLSVDDNFMHFKAETGLTTDITMISPGPFDYKAAVRAYLPGHLPTPGDEMHTDALVDEVLALVAVNPGKTFFLFTSYRALRQAAAKLAASADLALLVQGTMSRARLINAFMATPGAILLATQSFWEGVDVRGGGLTCVIIDKLPFPSPAEPLFRAQSKLLDENGRDSFAELSLPRTVLSLKQGFGRLMRDENDRGLFVIGDSRLRQRGYSDYVVNNLPEMTWLEDQAGAIAWLREL